MNDIVKRYHKGKFIYGEVLEIKKGKEVFQKVCDKCGGTGVLNHYLHTDNGICYKCKGNGKGTKANIDILFRIVDKKKKRRKLVPDFMLDKWRSYSIDELMVILNR